MKITNVLVLATEKLKEISFGPISMCEQRKGIFARLRPERGMIYCF